jgi:cell division protein FtsI (penicillin-binding protein 3)
VYEPGSTFKLVTYSAAIDGAGVEPPTRWTARAGR